MSEHSTEVHMLRQNVSTCELLTRMWRFYVCFWRWGYLHCRNTDKYTQLSYQLLLLTSCSGNRLLSITNKKLLLWYFKFHVKTVQKQLSLHSTFLTIFAWKHCLFCTQAGGDSASFLSGQSSHCLWDLLLPDLLFSKHISMLRRIRKIPLSHTC